MTLKELCVLFFFFCILINFFIDQCRDEITFNIKRFNVCLHKTNVVFSSVSVFVIPGQINQVKENLSKTPQELIPSVFINS